MTDNVRALKPEPVWDMELGVSAPQRVAATLYDDFLPALQGRKALRVWREMAANDATVSSILFAITMLAREITWTVTPGDESTQAVQSAEWLEEQVAGLQHPLSDTIGEAFTALTYGFSFHETVYKIGDGVSWDRFSYRPQDTLLRWELDDKLRPLAFIQTGTHGETIPIPTVKGILFRTDTTVPSGTPLIRGAYRCFSSDTDLLTENGWKPIDEVSKSDNMATLDKAHRLVFQHPTDIWEYEHEGDMLHIHSRFLDQLVTPNHRLYVQRDGRYDWELIDADNAPKSARHMAHAEWDAPDIDTFTIPGATQRNGIVQPDVTVDADAWATFLGWYLSEGNAYRRKSGTFQAEVVITQKTGPTADMIRDCLAKLPWNVYERANDRDIRRFVITDLSLYEHLHPLGKAVVKTVPRYVMDWSPRQIGLLLDSYALGDGAKSGGEMVGDYGPYASTDRILTASEEMADNLMELVLRAGYRPQKHWQNSQFGDGVWRITIGKPFNMMAKLHDVVDYEGTIHCVTVPNGVVYQRRNGKACWSGNSWMLKKRAEEQLMIGMSRNLQGLPKALVPSEILAAGEGNAIYDSIKQTVTRVKRDEQMGIMFPSDRDDQGNLLYEFDLVTPNANPNFDQIVSVIRMFAADITATVLAQFVGLGRDAVGSRALAEPQQAMFQVALGAMLDMLQDVFNRQAVDQLYDLNPDQSGPRATLTHGEVKNVDLSGLAELLLKTAQAGAVWFTGDDDDPVQAKIRMMAGLDDSAG